MEKVVKLVTVLGLMLSLFVMGAHAGKNVPGGGKRKENKAGFQKKHPRRAQVLKRGDRQTDRVNKALDHGKVNRRQATQLRIKEHKIRQQEEADAKKNGGHITKAEQRQLNREEKGVEMQLKRDEAQDARH